MKRKLLLMLFVLLLLASCGSKKEPPLIELSTYEVEVGDSSSLCYLIKSIRGKKVEHSSVMGNTLYINFEGVVQCPRFDDEKLGKQEVVFDIMKPEWQQYSIEIEVVDKK